RYLMHGADFLHGAAGSFWFGGLVGLSLYLAAVLGKRDDGTAPSGATTVVARFSFWAAIFFVGLALSGVVMAVRILGNWDALLHTTYGKVLIAKVLIVLLPLMLAAWNKFRLVPAVERAPDNASAWRHLRRTVLAEAAMLVVVLGVTGFLVLQNPNLPEASAESAAPAALPFAQTVPLGDGMLYVRVSPGDTGQNDVTVSVMDANHAPMDLLDHPQVNLTLPAQNLGPLTTMLEPEDDPGHYAGTIDIPVAGDWTLDVVTRVSKFEEPITSFQISFPNTGEATPAP
ncbi:MAG TPA: CopD family protein, partial [Thermomicrobiales bacterium]|nr:CopD family protein [Thermomicrobiales bacterium]